VLLVSVAISGASIAGCWIDRSPLTAPSSSRSDAGADPDLDASSEPSNEDAGASDAQEPLDAPAVSDAREPLDAFDPPDVIDPGDAPADCAAEACNRRDDDCDGLVDEASCVTDGAVACTAHTLGTTVYLVCPESLSWPEARGECEDLGYALVRIDSEEENAAVVGWAGATSWTRVNDRDAKGNFTWLDASAPTFTRWARGEPNDSWGEDCVLIRADGEWNDADCEEDSRPFVCEAGVEAR